MKVRFEQSRITKRTVHGLHAGWVKMQEKREAATRFSQAVALPQRSPALNLLAPNGAGVGPPIDYEGKDNAPIRIVLTHSDTIYRMGVQKIFAFEDDIQVVAEADTVAGLHDAIQHTPTDIIMLEGKLIVGTGDAIPELLRSAPKLKIIVQAPLNDGINTVELYRRGVQGIIPRSISSDLLVKCVRKIAAGETWIDNQSINLVIEAYRQNYGLTSPPTQPRLSSKELDIITGVMQGKRNKEIAYQLGTTEQVIKNYLRKVYDKLGVSDRLELGLYCLNHELPKKAASNRPPLSLLHIERH